MTQEERIGFQVRLSSVFRPGAPIDSKALFYGRRQQVDDVINAAFQPGQHVVMYGERGVGKTSLAKTLAEILKSVGVTPLSSGTINCDGTDDFSKLWHKVFRELQVVVQSQEGGFCQSQKEIPINLDSLLPEKATPDDVRFAITKAINIAAKDKRMIIILDEVDRITKKQVTTLLADTIKNLSDHLVPVTIILVGVADAVDQLISEHKSVERSIVQVAMPRMSPAELTEVVRKGFESATMTIADDAVIRIVSLSQGLPHFTHLLSLESAFIALTLDRITVCAEDVIKATNSAVLKSHSLLSSHEKATNSPHKTSLYKQVLLACSIAKKGKLGWFSASDVIEPMSQLMGKPYSPPYFARHLSEFSSDKRGPVFQKYSAARQHKYRFVNPLLEPFTIIHALATGMLPKSQRPPENPENN